MGKVNDKFRWFETEGEVVEIYNRNAPFYQWEYKLRIDDDRLSRLDKVKTFRVVRMNFSRATTPLIGDKVILKHKMSTGCSGFEPLKARIYKKVC